MQVEVREHRYVARLVREVDVAELDACAFGCARKFGIGWLGRVLVGTHAEDAVRCYVGLGHVWDVW